MTITLKEINKLSVSEKIILAEKIWESLPEATDELTISNNDKKILDHRLDNLEAGKARTVRWNDLKKKLKASI
ncbi:MAG: addiction module protein [Fibrobacter sp.]|nr:addiction module protein [Fibrobacter sp.]